ncbi:MAG: NAD(P)H-binding protein [Solirubrobacterales bacterium]|nr:NAD(P)H-binding protein [Solirubrobacterales bacterium]MCO5327270.1 NAD(P)H-binding protein [Solirubrobacterales bacterium]
MSTADGPRRPVYLIAGATGVIGRRLARALLDDGAEVRALVRDQERGRAILGPDVELFTADLLAEPELGAAMAGVELAYFLVHTMGSGSGYAETERAAAEAFATAASAAGVGRIVYLGGLGADEGGSPHLDSRHHTAEVLRELGPPLTYFRAAMIITPGSESYELLRSIATRLPALPRTAWLTSRTQPIGIRDVIAYLRAAPLVTASAGREIQIGGADVLPHLEVIARFARETGHSPPRLVPVPDGVASPGMVAAGAAGVTSGNSAVAHELALGLSGDTKVEDPSGAALFDIRPEPLNVAIQRALAEEERRDDG